MRLDQLLPGIGDLRAEDVQSYLRSRGFSRVDDVRDVAVVYANERGDEVVVPLKRDLADYARRLGELTETLARLDEQSPIEVLEALSIPGGTTLGERPAEARVHLLLPGPEYRERAIPAHADGRKVRVSGVLRRTGRTWTLAEPSGFEILPGDDE